MTFLLLVALVYIVLGGLTALAVRCIGIWEPMHFHSQYGNFGCTEGPADKCPAHWMGKKPIPLAT